ncbi:hypothetical protein H4R33_005860 [Dimargaris cristalligena]|uniref:Synaptobrevin homolog YKT6 n=1 Tax=Dimargaris cristalligena TaxID=215637 RepID=A0A4P9ZYS8_9FUNG|nr:hypothetical protein H4R33_005860 [Dimargaris cristalligena]RKP38122.1 synaptobrevin domain-containing protein [Dimargaris cristalligena]|eukprot:RKP38122.1 synaptobrevin domain-containing protein [Dimargaris cristalligena]
MAIITALVARGPIILAEHATESGNFNTVTQAILEKIPPNNSKLTYVYDRYLFHYICQDGIVYMCMADDQFGRRIPFAFLEEIKHQFLDQYSPHQIESALAYGMNEFSRTIARQMEHFSKNTQVDSIRQVQGEIAQVKDVMVQNIERVLERGERIDILVDKTDHLSNAAFAFRKRSTALKRSMWWKNTKLMAMLVLAILFMVYMTVSMACGFPGWDRCVGSGNP